MGNVDPSGTQSSDVHPLVQPSTGAGAAAAATIPAGDPGVFFAGVGGGVIGGGMGRVGEIPSFSAFLGYFGQIGELFKLPAV